MDGQLANANYGTASDVDREALELPSRERASEVEKLGISRRELNVGLKDVQEGRCSELSILEIDAEIANGAR